MAINRTEPTVGTSSLAAPESEVLALLEATGEKLGALSYTIEQLENRIRASLDDTTPQAPAAEHSFESTCRSPLGREMDYNVHRLVQLEQRLQGIIANTLL